jgi:small subunit ribosomal protein S9
MISPKKASPKKDSVAKKAPLAHAVGRRKSSVARVWLRPGQGDITVNGRPHTDYFKFEEACLAATKPFSVVSKKSGYDVSANVDGGGTRAQADAVKLAISRAMVSIDESIRLILREHGLLTVDSRIKERKKYGQKAARRKFQFVKR